MIGCIVLRSIRESERRLDERGMIFEGLAFSIVRFRPLDTLPPNRSKPFLDLKKLHCNGKPYWFSSYRDPSLQSNFCNRIHSRQRTYKLNKASLKVVDLADQP